jgi:hypothetical protein
MRCDAVALDRIRVDVMCVYLACVTLNPSLLTFLLPLSSLKSPDRKERESVKDKIRQKMR